MGNSQNTNEESSINKIPDVDDIFLIYEPQNSEKDINIKKTKNNVYNIIEETELLDKHKKIESLTFKSNKNLMNLMQINNDQATLIAKSMNLEIKKTKMTSSNNIKSLITTNISESSQIKSNSQFSKLKLKKNLISVRSTQNMTNPLFFASKIISNTSEIKSKKDAISFVDFELHPSSFEQQQKTILFSDEYFFGLVDKKIGLKLEIMTRGKDNEMFETEKIKTLYCNSYGFISSSKISAINSYYRFISEGTKRNRKYSLNDKEGKLFLFSIQYSQIKPKIRLCNNKLDLSLMVKNKDSITSLISIENDIAEYVEILKFYYNKMSKNYTIHLYQMLFKVTDSKVSNYFIEILTDGCSIYLHNCNVIVRIKEKNSLSLTLIVGDTEKSQYIFIGDSYDINNKIFIGTSNKCNLKISNVKGISKIQCTIYFMNGIWYLTDGDSLNQSKNGTFLLQNEDKLEISSNENITQEVRYRNSIFKLSKFYI